MADISKRLTKKASQFLGAGEQFTGANTVVPVGDTYGNAAMMSGRIAGGLVGAAAGRLAAGRNTDGAADAQSAALVELPKAMTVATTDSRLLVFEGHGSPKRLVLEASLAGTTCQAERRSQRGVKTQVMLFTLPDGTQFVVEANVFGPAAKLNTRLLEAFAAGGGALTLSD